MDKEKIVLIVAVMILLAVAIQAFQLSGLVNQLRFAKGSGSGNPAVASVANPVAGQYSDSGSAAAGPAQVGGC